MRITLKINYRSSLVYLGIKKEERPVEKLVGPSGVESLGRIKNLGRMEGLLGMKNSFNLSRALGAKEI